MIPRTRGPIDADIMIVGEAWGVDEERQGAPFKGNSGKELDSILKEAGIDPDACFFTCVINKRPPQGSMENFLILTKAAKTAGLPSYKGLYPNEHLMQGIIQLKETIEQVKPKIIIALGNYALWALTGEGKIVRSKKPPGYNLPSGIVQFRGSQLTTEEGIPVLATHHPSSVLRNWAWRSLTVHDLRARVPRALEGNWLEPDRDYTIRPSLDAVMEILTDLHLRAEQSTAPLLLACDIETQTIYYTPEDQKQKANPQQIPLRLIECVGIAWSSTHALCIPLMYNEGSYWSAEEEILIMQTLQTIMEHPNIQIVGQNFFFDHQYFYYYNLIKANYKHDTMLAHHVCYPGTPMGLDHLSSMYCYFHRYWKEDGKEASKNHNNEQRWTYNCRDCVVTYEVMETMWSVLTYLDREWQYALQMKRANAAIKMMNKGVLIDRKRKSQELVTHMEASDSLAYRIDTLLPQSLWVRDPKKAPWYRSPHQLKEIFYDVLGMEEILDRTTRSPTINDDALNKISLREPALRPLCNLLQQYRSLETFGSFVKMRIAPDNRIRATFSPTTETFRYRSSEDVFGYGRNLQNIPKGSEDA